MVQPNPLPAEFDEVHLAPLAKPDAADADTPTLSVTPTAAPSHPIPQDLSEDEDDVELSDTVAATMPEFLSNMAGSIFEQKESTTIIHAAPVDWSLTNSDSINDPHTPEIIYWSLSHNRALAGSGGILVDHQGRQYRVDGIIRSQLRQTRNARDLAQRIQSVEANGTRLLGEIESFFKANDIDPDAHAQLEACLNLEPILSAEGTIAEAKLPSNAFRDFLVLKITNSDTLPMIQGKIRNAIANLEKATKNPEVYQTFRRLKIGENRDSGSHTPGLYDTIVEGSNLKKEFLTISAKEYTRDDLAEYSRRVETLEQAELRMDSIPVPSLKRIQELISKIKNPPVFSNPIKELQREIASSQDSKKITFPDEKVKSRVINMLAGHGEVEGILIQKEEAEAKIS